MTMMRFVLVLLFALQVATSVPGPEDFCLWLPGLAVAALGFSLVRDRWFTGADLFWLVFLLLFVAAPAAQLEGGRFLGDMSVRGIEFPRWTVTRTVLMTDLMGLMVCVCQWLALRTRPALAADAVEDPPEVPRVIPEAALWWFLGIDLFLVLVMVFGLGGADFIWSGRAFPRKLWETNPQLGMFMSNFFNFIPVFVLFLAVERWRQDRRPVVVAFVIALGLVALAFNNPFNASRYQMAGIWFMVGLALLKGRVPVVPLSVAIVVFLAVVMPAMNLFREGFDERADVAAALTRGMDYRQLDYDAMSMATYATHFADGNGHTYGKYTLGTLLFFVPRGLWEDKPQPSAVDLGQDLIDHHSGWFTNLSTPPWADGYLDFGVAGVIACGLLIGVVLVWSDGVVRHWTRTGFLWRGIAVANIGLLPINIRGNLAAVVGYLVTAVVTIIAIELAWRWLVRRERESASEPEELTASPVAVALPEQPERPRRRSRQAATARSVEVP